MALSCVRLRNPGDSLLPLVVPTRAGCFFFSVFRMFPLRSKPRTTISSTNSNGMTRSLVLAYDLSVLEPCLIMLRHRWVESAFCFNTVATPGVICYLLVLSSHMDRLIATNIGYAHVLKTTISTSQFLAIRAGSSALSHQCLNPEKIRGMP